MVVLSAAITTRNGKALLARQFVDMNRIHIEGLLAAFPKLMGTGNKQHTFIETDAVRYVYQPIESLFLLLVTNKASNIVEDLETLRMLSKVVPDVAGGLTEEKVSGKAFELVFAFDEVITTGGHKENVSLQQIKMNMDMDSHEERLHNMIQDSKREAAKEEAGRKAAELRVKQKEMALRGAAGSGGMSGIGGGSMSLTGGAGIMGGSSMYTEASEYGVGNASTFTGGSGTDPWSRPTGHGGGMDSVGGFSVGGTSSSANDARSISTQGMKLGGGSKGKTMLESLIKEDHLVSVPSSKKSTGTGVEAVVPAAVVAASVHPVTLSVEERLSCQLTREGTLENMEVKGTLSLTANSDGANKCKVVLASTDSTGAFTFQTHPKLVGFILSCDGARPAPAGIMWEQKFEESEGEGTKELLHVSLERSKEWLVRKFTTPVNKGLYDSAKTLASKDQAKGFPVSRPVGVLRWSLSTTDESHLPLTINCWPEQEGGGQMNVSMEYELVRPMELHDVRITIPLGSSAVPQIATVHGSHRHNPQDGTLLWSMELLDQSNSTGSLEFNVASRDPEAFFPVTVTFASTQLFCNIQVSSVVNAETNGPLQYGYTASLTADSYTIS